MMLMVSRCNMDLFHMIMLNMMINIILFIMFISMNLMMSGAMWTGFEPEEEGLFNETYVEILQVFYGAPVTIMMVNYFMCLQFSWDWLQEIVDSLGKHGIYTYLDMHQVSTS